MEQAQPGYYTGDKARYVRDMFAGIAHRYDLLNSVLSFAQHRAWRRAAVRMAGLQPGDAALDVCTGTGDFALDLFRAVGSSGRVVGCDFCTPMLRLGLRKTEAASQGRIAMLAADALALPYPDSTFDCATVGFGIRNVADARRAFTEMARVVRPGGRVVCLEFSQPRNRLLCPLVRFYELKILPRIGALLSRSDAYTYLPKSIQAFHTREELSAIMASAGLSDIRIRDLNLGSVCIHIGTKSDAGSRADGTDAIMPAVAEGPA